MGVVKAAVGCAVAALLLGHQLSTMDAGRRTALLGAARAALGVEAPMVAAPAAPTPLPAPPLPSAPPPAAFEESIAPDRFGQFHAVVEIDGWRLPVMVDTGASFVSLSAEDADSLGIHPAPSEFRYAVSTANGRAAVAKVRLASVRLGGIEVRDVTALVSGRGQLGESLLGMSFLSRLSALKVDGGRLVLRQ